MKTSKINMTFCPSSCKTCAFDAEEVPICNECIDPSNEIKSDKVTCGPCPTNSSIQNSKCVCNQGFFQNGNFCTIPTPVNKCFIPSSISSSGLTSFG